MAKSDFQQISAPFSRRIFERLDIPDDVCTGCGYVEIISNTCALVDGCKSVTEYDDDIISLNLGKKSITFRGTSLSIKSLSMEQAMVEGFIVSVEFAN